MKQLLFVFTVGLLSVSIFAQIPQKMSYQAVVRNSSNVLLANQSIGMRVSILQDSSLGMEVYQETYDPNPVTNDNGLLSIEVGVGVPLSGDFSTIDWSDGTYYIMTELDPAGETDYSIISISQLMSVPYALHAKTAERISGGDTHYVGELLIS